MNFEDKGQICPICDCTSVQYREQTVLGHELITKMYCQGCYFPFKVVMHRRVAEALERGRSRK